jgi:hypothetical protein
LLLAIQGTIAYAMSLHAVLTDDWTARAASCGCTAVFDYKCNAQANDTLSSIEAHIELGRLKGLPKKRLFNRQLKTERTPRRTQLQNPRSHAGGLAPHYCPERCGYAKLGMFNKYSSCVSCNITVQSLPSLLPQTNLIASHNLFLLPLTIA